LRIVIFPPILLFCLQQLQDHQKSRLAACKNKKNKEQTDEKYFSGHTLSFIN